ncbi:hypothetical protein ABPG72_016013 [Tetrahymena utriculariae]
MFQFYHNQRKWRQKKKKSKSDRDIAIQKQIKRVLIDNKTNQFLMIYLNRTILLIHQVINLDNEFSLTCILFESKLLLQSNQLNQKQQIFSILNNHIYQQPNSNKQIFNYFSLQQQITIEASLTRLSREE